VTIFEDSREAATGGLDVGSIATQIVGSVVGSGILMVVVGLIRLVLLATATETDSREATREG
jgi:hypothetical protein